MMRCLAWLDSKELAVEMAKNDILNGNIVKISRIFVKIKNISTVTF